MNTINTLTDSYVQTPFFSGQIRQDVGLQVGDIFTLPCDFKVYSDGHCEFIFVINQHGEARKFYPTQITRKVGVYKDGLFTGQFVQGQGSVNEHAKKFNHYNDLMNSLKGKTIRVSNKTIVESKFGYRPVYHFDFV